MPPLYWKTERKYSATKQETTREPNAEGYYVFDLAVGGQIKQFKTKDKTIASAVDSWTQAFTLRTDGDIILGSYSVTVAKGIVDVYGNFDVMELSGNTATLKRNYPVATNYGEVQEVKFAKDCVFYDVSDYAEPFGAAATLEEGDRICGYINDDGEIAYCYIVYKNTRTAGYMSLCEHCDEEVFWEPFTGTVHKVDAHYYLTHDMEKASQMGIGSSEADGVKNDVVIDLNGKTLTCEKRAFLIYSTLSILDSAGGGKVISGNKDGAMGGGIMAVSGGTFNLYSGTLTVTEDYSSSSSGGILYVSGSGSTFNMYGGTVTGGAVLSNEKISYGGNIYINREAVFNMYGGTVSGGTVSGTKNGNGGNIYLAGSVFNMAGGTVTGGSATNGGNLYAAPASGVATTVNMTGGTITGGVAASKGGNIYITGDKTTGNALYNMAAGAITDGTAQGTLGGNIYAAYTDLTVDGTVSGGKFAAVGENSGANINSVNGILTISANGVVSSAGETNAKFGGNIAVSGDGSVVINGGKITGGEADHRGGNIFSNAAGSTITVNGGKITGGKAEGSFGGNILLASTVTLKLNGGEISGGTAKTNGGNISVAGVAGTVQIAGGKVSNGSIMLVGKDAENPAVCQISGGTVDCAVSVGNTSKLTLSGAPVITNLKISAGQKITLGELTAGAKITVAAKDIFTETNDNAASYKQYFIAAVEGDTIEVKDNALCYTKQLRPVNDPLVFDAGTTNAECALCGEKVTWRALSGDAAITFQDGDHYYLAADVTYAGTEGFLTAPGTGKEACLHLNGHNLAAASHRVLLGSTGILNIMGNGTVSGNYNNADARNQAATIQINTSGKNGTINLYGGTYVKADGNRQNAVVSIWNNGGKIEMFDGAVIKAEPGEYSIYVGLANLVDGMFTMTGGAVEGGKVYIAGANPEKGNISSLVFAGGTVSGGVEVAANSTVAITGAPVISGTGMKLAEGVKLLLGDLIQGASIVISAQGVFTEALADAESYVNYFTPAALGDSIQVVGNALSYKIYEPEVNDDLLFAPNSTTAYCPVCEETVEWTAITQEDHGTDGIGSAASGGHYYLSQDITYSGTAKFVQAPGTNQSACLHLNGHNLTSQNATAVMGYAGTINVMGNGTVSGNVSTANHGAAVHINTGGARGAVNLYGGTYTKPESNTTASVIAIWNNGGIIDLREEATVQGSVYIGTSNLVNSVFTSKGTINGSLYSAGANPEKGKASTVTFNGGTVGSVEIQGDTGVILSGKPVMEKLSLAAGVKLTVSELDKTASIVLSASGAFTETVANAADYVACFTPANPAARIVARENVLYCEKDFLSNLSFADGTAKAACPVCETEVEWKALTGDAAITLADGDHYYLASGVTFETTADTFLTAPGAGGTACLHLNGNDLAAKNSRVVLGAAGVLNIMGSGNVSGNFTGTSQHRGTVLDTGNGGTTGQLNLYGGTYSAEAANITNVLVTAWNGGTINVYDGAIINGGERTKDNVKIFYGVLNMYGGKIFGGTGRQVMTTNYSETKVGSFHMYGGEIVGNLGLFGSSQTKGTFTISGGTITGDVNVGASCTATFSGAPVINKLVIASGVKITLGELEQDASILVSATGIFTEVTPNAQAYLDAQYIKPADDGKTITVQDGALSIA